MDFRSELFTATSPANRRATRRREFHPGTTLMELMIGMFVFTTLALGVTGTVVQMRRLAQLNILRNAAWTVAQGYAEQMLSINPADLEAASEPWVDNRPPIPTESVNALLLGTQNVELADPLYVSPLTTVPAGANLTLRTDRNGGYYWNNKKVMVDIGTKNGVVTPIQMDMQIDVNISRAWTQVAGVWQIPKTPYFLIRLDFQFHSNGYLAIGWLTGTIRMVRTDLPGN